MISDEPELLKRLVSGEQFLVTAILQGRVDVEGDPMLAEAISGSMPEVGRLLARYYKEEPWAANP
jgi:hypothetical protein